jgi:DNA-binding MarR family transcriptional regulator
VSTPKIGRRALLLKLSNLGRSLSTQTVFLHQAIAQTFGLNATDTKCLDLVLTHPGERITAGWLSGATGLTTGAITHILDRLEKRGCIERVRDARDRRKVFVRARLETIAPLAPRYEAIGKAFEDLFERYSDDELRVISDYMERASAVSRRELARLIDARDSRTVPSATKSRPSRLKSRDRENK